MEMTEEVNFRWSFTKTSTKVYFMRGFRDLNKLDENNNALSVSSVQNKVHHYMSEKITYKLQ